MEINPIDIINKYYTPGSRLYNILYTHSCSVRDKALELAGLHPEMDLDISFIAEAALLHDLGVFLTRAPKIECYGEYDYICHGYLGAELLRKEGLERHALVCERHTGSGISRQAIVENRLPIPQRDMIPITPEEKLVCLADKFYSKSNLNEIKSIDKIRKSLSKYGEDSTNRWDEMVKLFIG